MTLSARPQTAAQPGRLVGGTLLGTVLVAAGLLTAYLTIATPLVATLVPAGPSGNERVAIGLGLWSLALIAGGGLLVSGTSRLAVILAKLRVGRGRAGPAARALGSRPDDLVVVCGVIPQEGRPIPELVIGAFGVAVVHARPSSGKLRRGGAGSEPQVNNRWQPTEDPLGAATRDADRVRHWLSTADLDFVVRVYAALVVNDRTLERSPSCAVITTEQIPAWIASLPRQRTLTVGRRGRLLAMAQPSGSADSGARTGSPKREW